MSDVDMQIKEAKILRSEIPNVKNISAALLEFQKNPPLILCTGENTFFKTKNGKSSKYPKLDEVYSKVVPVLNSLGVIITSYSEKEDTDTLVVELLHVPSDTCKKTYVKLLGSSTMQGWGSAETYGRRRGTLSMLGLVGEEDDDGNEADTRKAKIEEKPKTTHTETEKPKHNHPVFTLWDMKKEEAFKIDPERASRIQKSMDSGGFLFNPQYKKMEEWIKGL
jgi:hypothetical protein